ncbi:MAG: UDP-3-O-(3-hydroxymyristoyl)glucosamine N-acyltransferase [Gammaproteobacteria bacterium]|nr:UDP-3-O-(3-hydroxymyristoyl)glucosamine N-acyltransferase [Gammaproteobacteria bacterium]
MDLSLHELAECIGARLEGDGEVRVGGMATLAGAVAGDVSFLTNPAYRAQLGTTRASAVILGEEDLGACPTNALVMANPYAGYAYAATALNPPDAAPVGCHPGAHVDPSACIGEGVWLGPGAVVEANARIGAGCFIGPGCVVARGAGLGPGGRLVANVYIGESVRVGARFLIHPGAVIGADGFGFAQDGGRWIKIPQLGSVVLGDDVEIGANTAVDRGALEDTIIGDGVKLDNHVQIGHNVRIGEHTAIAGMSGVAGSAVIGRHCGIGGGVGVNGHVELADGVYLTVHTTVYQSILEPGVYSSGVMEQDNRSWRRNTLRFRQLDEMMKRIKALEHKLDGGM